VEVTSGTLSLARAGANINANVSTGATFFVEENAILDLSGGNNPLYYTGTYTGSGAGRVELSSGTLDARSDGGITFDFADGLFHWTGGNIQSDNPGGDAFTNEGVITLSGNAAKTLVGVLVNRDTIQVVDEGTFGGGTVNNEPSGLWDFQSDADFAAVTTVFNNQGTLRNRVELANPRWRAISIRPSTISAASWR